MQAVLRVLGRAVSVPAAGAEEAAAQISSLSAQGFLRFRRSPLLESMVQGFGSAGESCELSGGVLWTTDLTAFV